MVEANKRPSFIDAWLADVREDYLRYGKWKLLPWVLLVSIGVGAGISVLVPKEHFWDKPEVSVVFLPPQS